MVRPLNKLILSISTACLLLCGSAAYAAKATLDRSQISMNETATLTVESSDSGALPDNVMEALDRNFRVTNRGESKQVSCVNFDCTTTISTAYILEPKQPGIFTIPTFTLDGDTIKAQRIQVNAVNTDPTKGPVDNVFAELSVDKNKVSLQQQVLLTIKINTAINLTDLNIEPLDIPNTLLKELEQKSYQREIGGKLFQTYEIRYALFPQAIGKLLVPPATVYISKPGSSQRGFRSLFAPNRQERLRTNTEAIEVTRPPAHSGDWLPANALQLRDSWSTDVNDLKVGDSITRTITTTALGLSAEQLPPIKMDGTANYKIYPDQPSSEDRQNEDGILGIHTDTIAIVPTKAGRFELPPVTLEWWNITTQKMEVAKLPAVTLNVKPNPEAAPIAPAEPQIQAPAPTQPVATPAESPTPLIIDNGQLYLWQIATAVASALALLFAVLWLRARGSQPIQQEEQPATPSNTAQLNKALAALKAACASGSPASIRDALLAWSKLRWPHGHVVSTMDVARVLQDKKAVELIKALDAALFKGESSNADWNQLASICEASQKAIADGQSGLAPLYPPS